MFIQFIGEYPERELLVSMFVVNFLASKKINEREFRQSQHQLKMLTAISIIRDQLVKP